jgi:hypothetical protein
LLNKLIFGAPLVMALAQGALGANNIEIMFHRFFFMFGPPFLLAQGASVRH